MKTHTVSKYKDEDGDIHENEYVYRGVRFERIDRLKGYHGHYQTGRLRFANDNLSTLSSDTHKELLIMIDHLVESRESK